MTKDIVMLTTLAFPDYQKSCDEASALMERCRKVVSPAYILDRMHHTL